jgi:hypothetical protein
MMLVACAAAMRRALAAILLVQSAAALTFAVSVEVDNGGRPYLDTFRDFGFFAGGHLRLNITQHLLQAIHTHARSSLVPHLTCASPE